MNPFVAHLVGDFILQNEWMALNKKGRTAPCLVHVLVYLVPFLVCHLEWWQVMLIGIQHLVQDRTGFIFWWLRVWKRSGPDKWGNLPLYVDQAFHVLWIQIVLLLGN